MRLLAEASAIRFANSPDTASVFLSSNSNQGLTLRLATSDALLQAAQVCFVHLHGSAQPITARPHPSPAGTVQQVQAVL